MQVHEIIAQGHGDGLVQDVEGVYRTVGVGQGGTGAVQELCTIGQKDQDPGPKVDHLEHPLNKMDRNAVPEPQPDGQESAEGEDSQGQGLFPDFFQTLPKDRTAAHQHKAQKEKDHVETEIEPVPDQGMVDGEEGFHEHFDQVEGNHKKVQVSGFLEQPSDPGHKGGRALCQFHQKGGKQQGKQQQIGQEPKVVPAQIARGVDALKGDSGIELGIAARKGPLGQTLEIDLWGNDQKHAHDQREAQSKAAFQG